jgi:cytochrome c553
MPSSGSCNFHCQPTRRDVELHLRRKHPRLELDKKRAAAAGVPCYARARMKTKWIMVAGLLAAAVPAAVAADAKANWDDLCAKCHGAAGKGDTKMGAKLKVKDYSDPKVQAELKDDAMVEATLKGVNVNGKQTMKGFADKLNEQDAKDLVALIRSFKQ